MGPLFGSAFNQAMLEAAAGHFYQTLLNASVFGRPRTIAVYPKLVCLLPIQSASSFALITTPARFGHVSKMLRTVIVRPLSRPAEGRQSRESSNLSASCLKPHFSSCRNCRNLHNTITHRFGNITILDDATKRPHVQKKSSIA